jgi:photosystem II stability/assembly factor-like uncharacterized protein/uncharacterized protein (DUF2141 family)
MRKVFIEEQEPDNALRKISFYTPAQGYVAFRDWIGFTADSGRTFTKRYITESNVNYNGYGVNLTFGFAISGVKAFDQNNLIAYGDYGLVPAILRSTDGGQTFLLVFHHQFNPLWPNRWISDMVFPTNGNTGFAVDGDRILKTTDKGLTWTVSSANINLPYEQLEAIDNNNIIAVCKKPTPSGYFYKTADGGASWQLQYAPAGKLSAASFLTAAKAWINVDGKIFYTSNGGASWIQKTNLSQTGVFNAHVMKFVNDHTGYALGEQFTIYKTTDSGRIWEPMPRDNNVTYLGYTYNDLQVWDDNRLWAGGGHGLLELNTNPGGTTLPQAFFRIDTTGSYNTNSVQLINYSKPNYQYQWIVNGTPAGTTYHASYVHDIYRASDTVQLIVRNSAGNDTAERVHSFKVVPYPAPEVHAFTPTVAAPGTSVTITGNFFAGVSGVYFGGIPASSYTVQSLTKIVAVVGPGGNGEVKVTSATGIGSLIGFITSPPPVITSLSPIKAPIGATVTINGTYFGATVAENTVFFGGVKAVVLTASTNQLTVKVPAGATFGPLTVTVNNHIAHSGQFFSVTFASQCGVTDYSFAAGVRLPVDGTGVAFGIGDLDGDGKLDIGVPKSFGISVLRNKSQQGVIAFEEVFAHNADDRNRTSVNFADLDGDGKQDIVAVNHQKNEIFLYRNKSSVGTFLFDPAIILPSPNSPYNTMLHDLDGDGKLDMVVINIQANVSFISIYRNISLPGQIAFEPAIMQPVGWNDTRVNAGDLDGDGKPDLLVTDGGNTNMSGMDFSVLRNTSSLGKISFERTFVPHKGGRHTDADLGDVDGDGKLDIVWIYDLQFFEDGIPNIAVYRNTSAPGNISFDVVNYISPFGTSQVKLADLDGDGKIDLFSSGGRIMKNYSTPGNISLQNVSEYNLIIGGHSSVAVADFDNDGKPDLLGEFNQIYIYRNILGQSILAGKDTSICATQNVQLGYIDAIDHTYAWTSSAGNYLSSEAMPIVSTSVSTDYYVGVTDLFGCTTKDTVRITVAGPALPINAGTDGWICKDSTRQIGMNPVAGHTYSWTSLPEGFTSTIANPVVSPNRYETSYILTAHNGQCVARDTVKVYMTPLPPANAGADRNVCAPASALLGTEATGSNTYSWTSNPAGFTSNQARPYVYPTVNTSYYLVVTAPGGCKAYDTVKTQVNMAPTKPVVTASGPTGFCGGDSVILTSSVPTGNTWYVNDVLIPGATAASLKVKESGFYVARQVNGFCESRSIPLSVQVWIIPTPQITLYGGLLYSSALSGNQWYLDGVAIPGAVNNIFLPQSPGVYTVKVSFNDCKEGVSKPFYHGVTVINEPAWGNSLIVAPNPVQNDLSIRFTGNAARFTATVMDLHGRQVKSQQSFRTSCVFDLRTLNAGLYIIRVLNVATGEVINRTIVKE